MACMDARTLELATRLMCFHPPLLPMVKGRPHLPTHGCHALHLRFYFGNIDCSGEDASTPLQMSWSFLLARLKARPRIPTHSCDALHLHFCLWKTDCSSENASTPLQNVMESSRRSLRTEAEPAQGSKNLFIQSRKQDQLKRLYITPIQLNHYAFLSCLRDPLPRCPRQCSHIQYALPTVMSHNLSKRLLTNCCQSTRHRCHH